MIIKVKVFPNSVKDEIVKGEGEGEYDAYVKDKTEENRANLKLIKIISKHFGVSFRKVKIKNPKSRNKIIEIKI